METGIYNPNDFKNNNDNDCCEELEEELSGYLPLNGGILQSFLSVPSLYCGQLYINDNLIMPFSEEDSSLLTSVDISMQTVDVSLGFMQTMINSISNRIFGINYNIGTLRTNFDSSISVFGNILASNDIALLGYSSLRSTLSSLQAQITSNNRG